MPFTARFVIVFCGMTALCMGGTFAQSTCRPPPYHFQPVSKSSPALKDEASKFLERYARDPLITIWPCKPEVSAIADVYGLRLYEVTCRKWGPFDEPGFAVSPTQTFFLYKDGTHGLARINLQPAEWANLDVEKIFYKCRPKSIKAFGHFLTQVPRGKTLSNEDQACLFVSLMFQYWPTQFPCVVFAAKDVNEIRIGIPSELDGDKTKLIQDMSSPTGLKGAHILLVVAYYRELNALIEFRFQFTRKGKIVMVEYQKWRDIAALHPAIDLEMKKQSPPCSE